MQRLLAGLFATTLLASVPLQAQDAPPPLKNCRALLKSARGEIARTPQTEIEDLQDGCRFTHVGLAIDSYVTADMDELIIRTPDLLTVWPTGEVFRSADLTLKGFALLPGQKFDLQLVYDTDPDSLTAHLERLHLDAGALGNLTLSARLSQFDNADLEAPSFENEKGRLHEFDMALVDTGLSSVFLPSLMLITGMPTPADITKFDTMIGSLPEDRISSASAKSLTDFVDALPDLSGRWTLHFQSDDGLALGTIFAGNLENFFENLPADARLEATAAKP